MRIKKIISIFLGLFVLSAIAYSIFSGTKKEETTPDNNKVVVQKGKVVNALYFHGTNRCYTCNIMEGYIRELIQESFSKELESGKLSFESINVEEPSNSHYVQRYQLRSISFFLSLKEDGKELKFENLDQIWKLARNKTLFKDYIKKEIKKFLEA